MIYLVMTAVYLFISSNMPTINHILIPTKKSGGEGGVCEQEGMPEMEESNNG